MAVTMMTTMKTMIAIHTESVIGVASMQTIGLTRVELEEDDFHLLVSSLGRVLVQTRWLDRRRRRIIVEDHSHPPSARTDFRSIRQVTSSKANPLDRTQDKVPSPEATVPLLWADTAHRLAVSSLLEVLCPLARLMLHSGTHRTSPSLSLRRSRGQSIGR